MAPQKKTQTQKSYERDSAIRAMEQIEKEREYMVVKSNDLVRGTSYYMKRGDVTPLTAQQNKIIAYLISQIKPDDTSIPVFHFNIQRFATVCGLSPNAGGSYYAAVNKSIEQLMQKTLKLRSDDGDDEVIFHYIQSAKFSRSNRSCDIVMDPILTSYLCRLQSGNNTGYAFKRVARFNCMYSHPLYELCKSYAFAMRGFRVDVDELKEHLGCKSYNVSNLRKLVLDKAIDEINTFTELEVAYSFQKEGRRIAYVYFDVRDLSKHDGEEDLEKLRERNINLEYEFEQYSLFPMGA